MKLVQTLLKYYSTTSVHVMSDVSVATALINVRENITVAHKKYIQKVGKTTPYPCLIAVSKTKPHELIKYAYNNGQRDFGENYVQELIQKAAYFKDEGYDDIRWHFIGHLQRNKVNNLLAAPNIEVIQTVDNIKLANAINKSWKNKAAEKKLKVFAQVNSSGEENKSGCSPTDCSSLVEHIRSNCDCLQLEGLMTIGSFNHDYSTGPNPDFHCLIECRKEVSESLNIPIDELQLSMGMSADYEQAILAGSTTVRIGSTIFGARETKQTIDKTSNEQTLSKDVDKLNIS